MSSTVLVAVLAVVMKSAQHAFEGAATRSCGVRGTHFVRGGGAEVMEVGERVSELAQPFVHKA